MGEHRDRNRADAQAALTRRRFLAVGSAAAIAGLLAACGGGSAATDTPKPAASTGGTGTGGTAAPAATTTTATQVSASASAGKPIKGTKLSVLWQPPAVKDSETAITNNINDWAKAAGVGLTFDSIGADSLEDKLAVSAQTKQGPDLLELYAQDVAANANFLTDVTDLANELGARVGGWYDSAKGVCIQNGKWIAIPAFTLGEYWTYRTDIFQQVGASTFPATWDEMHQIGTKLKANGTPIGFPLGHAVTDGNVSALSLLWSYGGNIFASDNKTIALDSKETLDCLTFFQSFYHDALAENAFGWDETGNNNAYISGQSAATINANTIYLGLRTSNADLAAKTSHAGALKGPAGSYLYMTQEYWAIPSYGKNPDAAKAYLRDAFFDLKFQSAVTLAGNGYNLPPFAALEGDNSAWPTDPKLAAAKTLAKTARVPGSPGPFSPQVGQVLNKFILIDMFAKVAQGTAPKDAITGAVNEINVILKGA